jgi:hypothetical protein
MDFATASRRRNLPVKLTRLIGRREIIDNMAQQLSMQRLLTIVDRVASAKPPSLSTWPRKLYFLMRTGYG